MNLDLKPINKQAAIFLSKRNRLETIEEAIDVFAQKILDAGPQIRSLLKASDDGTCVQINFLVHRDDATPDCYKAKLTCSICPRKEETHYLGLK